MKKELSVTITKKSDGKIEYCFIDNESGDMTVRYVYPDWTYEQRYSVLGGELNAYGELIAE